MEKILTILLLLLLGIFCICWMLLHMLHKKRLRGDAFMGDDLGLDDLANLKSKLSEEEYRSLRRTLVEKMTRESGKEVNLSDLHQEFAGQDEGQAIERDSEASATSDESGLNLR